MGFAKHKKNLSNTELKFEAESLRGEIRSLQEVEDGLLTRTNKLTKDIEKKQNQFNSMTSAKMAESEVFLAKAIDSSDKAKKALESAKMEEKKAIEATEEVEKLRLNAEILAKANEIKADELLEKNDRLDDREEKLVEQQLLVDAQEKTLGEKIKSVGEREEKILDKVGEIEDREFKVIEDETKLVAEKAQWKVRDEALVTESLNIGKLKKDYNKLFLEVTAKINDVDLKEKDIAEREEKLKADRIELNTRERGITDAANAIENKTLRVKQRERKVEQLIETNKLRESVYASESSDTNS